MKGRSDRTGKEITNPVPALIQPTRCPGPVSTAQAFWGHLFTGKVSLLWDQVSHFSFKCKCSPFPWILLEMAQRAWRVFDHLNAPLLVFPTLSFHSCLCVVLCSVLSMDQQMEMLSYLLTAPFSSSQSLRHGSAFIPCSPDFYT